MHGRAGLAALHQGVVPALFLAQHTISTWLSVNCAVCAFLRADEEASYRQNSQQKRNEHVRCLTGGYMHMQSSILAPHAYYI
jgi:hypothetical protein